MRRHDHTHMGTPQDPASWALTASPPPMADDWTSCNPAVLALVDRIVDTYRDSPEHRVFEFLDNAHREPVTRRSYTLELTGCGLAIDHRFDFAAAGQSPRRPARSVTFRAAHWLGLHSGDKNITAGAGGDDGSRSSSSRAGLDPRGHLTQYPGVTFQQQQQQQQQQPPPRQYLLGAKLDVDYARRHDAAELEGGRCPVGFWHHEEDAAEAEQQQQQQPGGSRPRVRVHRSFLGASFAQLLDRMDAWACAPMDYKEQPVWLLEGMLLSLVLFMHPRVARAAVVVPDHKFPETGRVTHRWGVPGQTPEAALEWLQSAISYLPILP
ncbi:hypothetical protein GGTG_10659 [Gaeumannomyces tritici R3-111a-1]|uniref:Uncharacterized protein n=1 Tax=Gaeumannomyces tritici (strain R3-111a-1) TaxID=644352 RepID=J3PAY4_GAET3|nr:hypothetical protein GGTG_10659 [Gaeumannomyces tritici R3-111a-1]EJT71400.1 hypothetical protein GGTG_10659 [Gaeumannomyces tritici R3-111a-1]